MSGSWVEVDLRRIGRNLELLRSLAQTPIVIAVIKANAYGHGLLPVARYLEGKADILAVARLSEAIQLRKAGIRAPILNLFPVLPSELDDVVEYRITQNVDNLSAAVELSNRAVSRSCTVKVHMMVDTGMTRTGVWYEHAPEFARRLSALPGIEFEGIATHFACADEPDRDFTAIQMKRFTDTLDLLIQDGINPRIKHVANSAATIAFPDARFNAIRPGLALYGVWPLPGITRYLDLQPALTWKTRIISIKSVERNQPIGYGCTFIAKRASKIATLSVGYADGYRRHLSNRGYVLIKGARAPIVGNICMDLTMCDISDIGDVSVGGVATLVGKDGDEEITVEDIAELSGTIPYEILTGIGSRVERVYSSPLIKPFE